MEAVSCLKSLVSAAGQFRSNGSDENLVHLLRQLDVRFTLIIGQFSDVSDYSQRALCMLLYTTLVVKVLVGLVVIL